MKGRISKRVREEAARLASAGACAGHGQHGVFEAFESPLFLDAISLLWAAYKVATVKVDDGAVERERQEWAEAEAMLRTGWCPP